jgi:hypothetical protein
MKTYGGVDIFLTSVLVGSEWSASYPSHFTPRERVSGTHWTGGWVGPRTSLDNVEKIEALPLPGLEPCAHYRMCWSILQCLWNIHWVLFMSILKCDFGLYILAIYVVNLFILRFIWKKEKFSFVYMHVKAEDWLETFVLKMFISCRKFTWSFLCCQAEEEDEDDDLPRKDEL